MVKFIEDDLKAAAVVLPMPGETEYGKFDKGVANMLLIRLYLHEKQWIKSWQPAMKSSDTTIIPLILIIVGIVDLDGAINSPEVIWAIPCDYEKEPAKTNGSLWHCLPTILLSAAGQPCKSTWYFYDSFEKTT
jgi:hypothetical protein